MNSPNGIITTFNSVQSSDSFHTRSRVFMDVATKEQSTPPFSHKSMFSLNCPMYFRCCPNNAGPNQILNRVKVIVPNLPLWHSRLLDISFVLVACSEMSGLLSVELKISLL